MSKKLLKNLEGAVIEKVTADAASRKVKIKTNKGTITIEFDDYTEAGSELGAERIVDIDFKEPKTPKVVPEQPSIVRTSPGVTAWPFPTGNKP